MLPPPPSSRCCQCSHSQCSHSQCSAAGQEGNFWYHSKLLKPDPMPNTKCVQCLLIPHKIRKKIGYSRQRHAKCQKVFECAINKHEIVYWFHLNSEISAKAKVIILRGFDQPRREFHCSFLQECGKNNQSAGDTDGPVPGARGCYGQIWHITWPFYTLRPSYIRVLS